MRVLIILSVITFSIACSDSEKAEKYTIVKKKSIEEKALDFFIDSLLYKKELFDLKKPAFKSESLNLHLQLGMMDDAWNSEGLLSGKQIYTDGVICGVSQPYFFTKQLTLEEDLFIDDYQSKAELEEKVFTIPNQIKNLSWDNFLDLRSDNAFFLCVRHNINNSKYSLIDLELINSNGNSGYVFTLQLDSVSYVVDLSISTQSFPFDNYQDRCSF